MTTPAELVAEYLKLDDWLTAENKRYAEHIKPVQERMAAIKDVELREMLLALGSKVKQSISTDHGTVYTSTIMKPKIADREKYLDDVLKNWDQYGNAMMQLAAPQKDAVKDYMEAHEGNLPPGVDVSTFTNVNIRRS